MSRVRRAASVTAAVAILAFVVCAPAFAATPAKASTSTKIPLWKVTSPQRTLYVTGAMGTPLKARPVPERTAQAFDQSGAFVAEAEVGPKATARAEALLKQYEPLRDGQTLADELTDTQLQHTKKLLAMVGLEYADVQHDEPWAVLMHIGHAAQKMTGRKPHPRFQHFQDLAQQRQMAIEPLDTARQEIEMMANLPEKLQVAMLMQAVHGVMHPQTAVANKRGTRKAWAAGDMPGAAKHFDSQFKKYPGLYEAIVTSRHDRWTGTLAAMLDQSGKPVFVVIGAPHLFGPDNLLDHLREDGYTVTQL